MIKLLVVCLAVTGVSSLDLLEGLPIPAQYLQGQADQNQQSICVHQTLNHCQTTFTTSLNMSAADWTDPNAMGLQLSNIYNTSVGAFLSMCQSRQLFQLCLGDMYAACMSVPRFVRDGATLYNASAYVQMFSIMQFDCDGGLVQATQNYDCILNVTTRQVQEFINCFNTFNNTITKDPTQICPASIKYEQCTRLPFQVACGPEVSWWMCERTRVSAGLDQLCPAHYCQVTQTVRPAAAASRRKGIENIMRGSEMRNSVMRSLAQKKILKQR